MITSKDGKYIYKQSENNDEAVFWGSTQKNITVLEIPDEIDGKKVTGVERIFTMSKAVTKLVLGKNIKTIGYGGLKLSYVTPSFENVYNWIKYDEYKEVAPLINIRFNEGLETIESFAMREAPCMAEAP
ncbi:MAG: hypothetical protein IK085_00685, partial [Clostridia bacterium]|nr:hypothetical protein [Clostridia bacterium]